MDNCEFNEYNMYNVPAISFIGGSRQQYVFRFYESDLTTPVSMIGTTAISFRLVPYGFTDDVVLEVSGTLLEGDPYNAIQVVLSDTDTAHLHGKYVYQIIITSYNSGDYIPVQGILNIFKKFEDIS